MSLHKNHTHTHITIGGIVKELNTTQTLNHNLNKTSATEIKRNSEQFL
jgi:hypothetical protein